MVPNAIKRGLIMTSILIGFTSNAPAIDLESLILPGKLIQGHEELATDCDQCHASFAKDQQNNLCRDCHEDVSADIDSRAGFHGRFPDARTSECSGCHTDHEGRGADIVGFVRDTLVAFSLLAFLGALLSFALRRRRSTD